MTKQELRAIYKQKRAEIPAKEKLRLDDLLLLQFQRLYFAEAGVLLTYWPLEKQAEPNTHLFSGFLRHTIPGLAICYPVINHETGTFNAVVVSEHTVYQTNKYGITEPKTGTVVAPNAIDIVFVPMLVCDLQGARVGYGKGFYDKYLAACRKNVIKIGFNYFAPVDKIADTQYFDIPLDYCVTTTHIYEF